MHRCLLAATRPNSITHNREFTQDRGRVKRQSTQRRTAHQTGAPRPKQDAAPKAESPASSNRLALLGLCLLSAVLSVPLFAPWSFWPLGYVAFVPWLVAIARADRRRWAYLGSYLLGAAFFLFHFRWLYATTPEGYVAASLLYLALAFPLGAWPIRHLYRGHGVRLTFVFPVVWTAIEILRTYNPLGFPWFFIGHSQIRLLPMIQVADLAGVYGVTFVVAMVNGLLADLVLERIARRESPAGPPDSAASPQAGQEPSTRGPQRRRPGLAPCTLTALVFVAGTFGYGAYRLHTSRFTDGPLTAVLQGDFLLAAVVNDPNGATDAQKEDAYFDLIAKAVADRPELDLIVLPETPWGMYLNREWRQAKPQYAFWHDEWVHWSRRLGKSIVVGAMAEEPQPKGTYPPQHRYNAAYLYTPGEPEPQRYNKIHLVPFGEYVPFRYSKHFRFIYEFFAFGPWNPWGRDGYEYSLTPGREFTVMKLPQAASGRNGRFGVTICYEDVIPRIFRRFVYGNGDGKRVDFMLNISNDGWFGHGTQQAQHLVNCAFRAVENRIGVARAVNTGISGFVDPDGSWRDLVQEPGRRLHAGGMGHRVATVKLDSRLTVYSRYGDVFGLACLGLTLLAMGESSVRAFRRRRERIRERAGSGKS